MPTEEQRAAAFKPILDCAKTLPPVKTALILYNRQPAEVAKGFFDKMFTFRLSEIGMFPKESFSSLTATLTLGVKGANTFALVSSVSRSGFSVNESVALALLLKSLGTAHAFTLVLAGKHISH